MCKLRDVEIRYNEAVRNEKLQDERVKLATEERDKTEKAMVENLRKQQ